ncbi:hypothetical protein GPLA_1162 [Paraglaciecola polaris LMG 21857]|uniref:Uncharacterized protein n=1 Tax=Paraglaciecola polaris LMG 21857 TaxID=1129793 RepID=K6ZP56_9ALTE|nr:hypothetical protein GPLA_1162 [Paraglaciecola polaris LMG 21857]
MIKLTSPFSAKPAVKLKVNILGHFIFYVGHKHSVDQDVS